MILQQQRKSPSFLLSPPLEISHDADRRSIFSFFFFLPRPLLFLRSSSCLCNFRHFLHRLSLLCRPYTHASRLVLGGERGNPSLPQFQDNRQQTQHSSRWLDVMSGYVFSAPVVTLCRFIATDLIASLAGKRPRRRRLRQPQLRTAKTRAARSQLAAAIIPLESFIARQGIPRRRSDPRRCLRY